MDYRQTSSDGTSWRRAAQVIVNNPLGRQASLSFQEQDVMSMGPNLFQVPTMTAVVGLFEPDAVIPLLNPATGEPLGTTATHQDLYVLLHSLYMQLALLRDAGTSQGA